MAGLRSETLEFAPKMLQERINLERAENRVRSWNRTHRYVVGFDFDELLVATHMSRTISERLSSFDSTVLEEYGGDSFMGISYLLSRYTGRAWRSVRQGILEIADRTPWSEGALITLTQLQETCDIAVLSSGLREAAEIKLRASGVVAEVFGSELEVSNGTVRGPRIVVTATVKRNIVNRLRAAGTPVVAVGHSLGDEPMLVAADLGIVLGNEIRSTEFTSVAKLDDVTSVVQSWTKQYDDSGRNEK